MLNEAMEQFLVVAREEIASSDMFRCRAESAENSVPVNNPSDSISANPGVKTSDWIYSDLPMDEPEFVEIVIDFVPQLNAKLDEMQEKLDAGDLAELAVLAHWLKGAGGTCGFNEFYEPSLALEKAAKSDHSEDSKKHLRELKQLARRIWVPSLAEAEAH